MRTKKALRFQIKMRSFLKRWGRLLLIAAIAVVLVVFFVVVFPRLTDTPDTPPQVSAAPSPVQDELPEDVELATDAEMLAGLSGEDSSVFERQIDPSIRKIGVTVIDESTATKPVLSELEQAGTAAVEDGTLDQFYMYPAQGSENQQIQDVYTMINSDVRVIIVVDASEYNFGKIAEIAKNNGVLLVAYNTAATDGFAVNVVSGALDSAKELAQHIKDAGVANTRTLGASESQLSAVKSVLTVDAANDDMWDAVYEIRAAIEAGNTPESAIVFDYNANDVLRTWLRAGALPKAYAGTGTVVYIKTWYQLLHGGVEVEASTSNDTGDAENAEEPAEPEQTSEPQTINATATPEQFKGFAVTSPGNVGAALYAFALHLLDGDTLSEPNFVFEIPGAEIITNETLESYYNKVKDQDSGLVTSDFSPDAIQDLFNKG